MITIRPDHNFGEAILVVLGQKCKDIFVTKNLRIERQIQELKNLKECVIELEDTFNCTFL